MGGFGSGRQCGRPTADESRKLDIAWMMREGFAVDGCVRSGIIRWTCNGQPAGSISYVVHMLEPGHERLELSYTRGSGGDAESVKQTVQLTFTNPNYGGKRWWMICPYRGHRVGKLYLPNGGDRFASRTAWRLGYQSQRQSERDKPFERLFRLQRRLGCDEGWGNFIRKPKGMWQRTFDKHFGEYCRLSELCDAEMATLMARIS